MGARHFRQMFEDALDIDCRALMLAMMMRTPTKAEFESKLGAPWADTPNDKLMDIARKLLPLDTEFSEQLKRRLLSGDICVLMTGPDLRPHKIRDPDVITFDDLILTDEAFYELLEVYLADKISSGEQN